MLEARTGSGAPEFEVIDFDYAVIAAGPSRFARLLFMFTQSPEVVIPWLGMEPPHQPQNGMGMNNMPPLYLTESSH